MSAVHAASYDVASESELIAAINSANAAGDANPVINLQNDISISSTPLPALSKHLTVSTNGFVLSSVDGINPGTSVAFATPLPGGSLTIAVGSEIQGGDQATGSAGAQGGVGLALHDMTITNNGSISGGERVSGLAQGQIFGGVGDGQGLTLTNGTLVNNGTITGGSGQAGARASGYGVLLTGGTGHVNNGLIQGGLTGTPDFAQAGLAMDSTDLVNNGTIRGGGNFGSNADGVYMTGTSTITNNASGQIYGADGNSTYRGGDGLSVVDDVNVTIVNQGLIRGATTSSASQAATNGISGLRGSSGAGFPPPSTANGTIHVINSGTIAGGSAGNGELTAILMTGAFQLVLEQHAGSVIDGAVKTNASKTDDIFRLGGEENDTFDVSTIGSTKQYRGFDMFEKTGSSTWTITGQGTDQAAPWSIYEGTMAMSAGSDLGDGPVHVLGGRLQGIGTVGTTTHEAGGTIAPGNSIGTLTIDGDYVGNGGLVEVETVLGDDGSSTDLLKITGNTSGTADVKVINVDGTGAPTTEGIKIIEVGGRSDGVFSLKGDYALDGEQVIVGGAYAYRLYQNGVSTPTDGDWYLRSTLKPVDTVTNPNPAPTPPLTPAPEPEPQPQPLYQAGAPVYEAYPQTLMALNGLPTLQQRVGNRYWSHAGNLTIAQGADAVSPYAPAEESGSFVQENGVWGRIEGDHNRFKPNVSTTDGTYDLDTFKLQAGLDGMLHETESGKLIGGITVHYGHASADIFSPHGDGEISTDGYGFGGALTWYSDNGFYLDGQAQATWYRSDLSSNEGGVALADGNDGFGYAVSLETGKKIQINDQWSWTPQGQLIYSSVDFDSFRDPFGANVSLHNGDSLQGRFGLSFDRQNAWQNSKGLTDRIHAYGIGNLYYEFLDGASVELAGTRLTSRNERLWGGVGFGGSYNWDDDKYSLYGEASLNTSLNNFGDSYNYKGNVGFRVKW
nr:autotransporter outer membrane beta-barrel domain-containing protein [Ochrobactrum sp. CM-21-5]